MFSLSRLRRPVLLATAALLAAAPFAAASAAEWVVDPAKSTLAFSATQTGNAFEGKFGKWSGTIDFDPANPAAGHAAITIDVASAATGDTQKDEALPQPDWFDASKFPNAVFEVKSFKAKGGDEYDAVGTLTIRDKSRDLVLPVKIDISGDTAHATGSVKLVRTDYGVGQGSWSDGQYVGLDVEVKIDVTATRKN
ncbi:YceI family protein [Segnochrobactrum spirostomi]|uniref:YceI family protein n=1 Tax=Segnochrobactrum spirostomi TaxID=2608987 RepID=A0A6A7Y9J5_9HYPH|nr:YceI family protein [Segnochrobactrum spirostomi]MQT15556.1 YceI family protein [Segnochrobactrum spirostomi]